MNYFQAANRAILVFWMGWLLYWVGFVHWRWANDLAQEWVFPPKNLPADFFDEPRKDLHEWVVAQKLNDSRLATEVRQYSRSHNCQQAAFAPPSPRASFLDCQDPYSDMSDHELAQRVRAKYDKEYRSYFEIHWHQFEKYKGWTFGDYYKASLRLSWFKSRPPGVEFLSGLIAPGLMYGVFALAVRWVWRGSKRA